MEQYLQELDKINQLLVHKGVERHNGDPYIFHALRVANNKTYIRTKLQKAVAILHDVIEDTPLTRSFLAEKKASIRAF